MIPSYGHCIVDGRDAVTFLMRVKECLEDPQRFALDLWLQPRRAQAMTFDYTRIYNLEQYLFGEVKKTFDDTGDISPFDFLPILHWKSARSRTKTIDRLKDIVGGTFGQATKEIALALSQAPDSKKRLEVLMIEWKFRLPTATAILTVLYPEEFTIYDKRVREVLGFEPIRESFSETRWSQTWDGYKKFMKRVNKAAPASLSLRDKDRFLWGKSLSATIKCDLRR